MKKIVLSVFSMVAVLGLALGGVSSYFTNQKGINGMQVTSGTLEITDNSEGWTKHVSFKDLKPGDNVRKWVAFKNTGTLDVGSLKVTATNASGDLVLLDNLRVSAYNTVEGYDQGIYTPDWGKGQPVLTHLNGLNLLGKAVYSNGKAGTVLAPGKTASVLLEFKVPASLGNEFQGKEAGFDLVFDASQVENATYYF